jgi:hypothetical protein
MTDLDLYGWEKGIGFGRSQILAKAWATYRWHQARKFPETPRTFASCLAGAWRVAQTKQEASLQLDLLLARHGGVQALAAWVKANDMSHGG